MSTVAELEPTYRWNTTSCSSPFWEYKLEGRWYISIALYGLNEHDGKKRLKELMEGC